MVRKKDNRQVEGFRGVNHLGINVYILKVIDFYFVENSQKMVQDHIIGLRVFCNDLRGIIYKRRATQSSIPFKSLWHSHGLFSKKCDYFNVKKYDVNVNYLIIRHVMGHSFDHSHHMIANRTRGFHKGQKRDQNLCFSIKSKVEAEE